MKSDEILEGKINIILYIAAKVIQKHWRNKTERGKEKVNEVDFQIIFNQIYYKA